MYKVQFQFRNEMGKWVDDELTNNGKGFTYKEARETAIQIRDNSIPARYIEIVKM